jgi:hypothetical protein
VQLQPGANYPVGMARNQVIGQHFKGSGTFLSTTIRRYYAAQKIGQAHPYWQKDKESQDRQEIDI